jgi:hypothetical protein
VTVRIVDPLKAVHVDHGQRQAGVLAFAAAYFLRQHAAKAGVVEQAGQAVAHHVRAQGFQALQAAAHQRHQVGGFDGLGEKIVAAQAHHLDVLGEIVLAGKEYNRNAHKFIHLADQGCQLGAVHRHVQVHQTGPDGIPAGWAAPAASITTAPMPAI